MKAEGRVFGTFDNGKCAPGLFGPRRCQRGSSALDGLFLAADVFIEFNPVEVALAARLQAVPQLSRRDLLQQHPLDDLNSSENVPEMYY